LALFFLLAKAKTFSRFLQKDIFWGNKRDELSRKSRELVQMNQILFKYVFLLDLI
jgi:hypothetical protein